MPQICDMGQDGFYFPSVEKSDGFGRV
jgi:hypothetical protein